MRLLMWLAIAGFSASAIVHLCSILGVDDPFGPAAWALHIGIFVVWFPAVLAAQRMTRHAKQSDFWRVILRGSPVWARRGLYLLLPYAILNFIVGVALGARAGFGESRLLSGHWLVFYYGSAVILHAARTLVPLGERACPQGHAVSLLAELCEKCGASTPLR